MDWIQCLQMAVTGFQDISKLSCGVTPSQPDRLDAEAGQRQVDRRNEASKLVCVPWTKLQVEKVSISKNGAVHKGAV